MAGVHQQPDQSNYLAEGQTLTCKVISTRYSLYLEDGMRGPHHC